MRFGVYKSRFLGFFLKGFLGLMIFCCIFLAILGFLGLNLGCEFIYHIATLEWDFKAEV